MAGAPGQAARALPGQKNVLKLGGLETKMAVERKSSAQSTED